VNDLQIKAVFAALRVSRPTNSPRAGAQHHPLARQPALRAGRPRALRGKLSWPSLRTTRSPGSLRGIVNARAHAKGRAAGVPFPQFLRHHDRRTERGGAKLITRGRSGAVGLEASASTIWFRIRAGQQPSRRGWSPQRPEAEPPRCL
jgi:hypothetical protein